MLRRAVVSGSGPVRLLGDRSPATVTVAGGPPCAHDQPPV